MRCHKNFILISTLFLSVLGLEAQEARYSPYWHQRASLFRMLPDTEDEIIFLGDSLTDGCNWGEIFQDFRIKNRGISGDTTEGVLARLEEIVEGTPLKVFLMIGINDLAKGTSSRDVVENTKKIVKYIQKRSPRTEIYLTSLLPVNSDFSFFPRYTNKTEEIIAVNQSLQQLVKAFKLTYIDVYSLMTTSDKKLNPRYTNDGLHLTGEGYRVWKSVIEKHVQN